MGILVSFGTNGSLIHWISHKTHLSLFIFQFPSNFFDIVLSFHVFTILLSVFTVVASMLLFNSDLTDSEK